MATKPDFETSADKNIKLKGVVARQTSLTNQVTRLLRESILSGQLKPGERLVERSLAKSLQVGQSTVREAMQVLEHEGLILKRANKGSTVTRLSSQEAKEIVDIRMDLEPKAFILAHRRMNAEHFRKLEGMVRRIDDRANHNDYYGVSQNDFIFHKTVWNISQNYMLERILNYICTPLFAYLTVLPRNDLRGRVKSHSILLDHLRDGDERALAQAVRDHLTNAWVPLVGPDEMQET